MQTKKVWLFSLSILIVFMLLIPILHVLKTRWKEKAVPTKTQIGYTNDASGLNLTQVDSIIEVSNQKAAIENQLKDILQYARQKHLKISIAGAKHSMGGHTIYPNGIVLNMLPYKHIHFDTSTQVLTVGSGALWEDVLKYLDSYGKSIPVMQAFSSFSVGGSLSVNGHGWQKNSPPVASGVIAFTLLTSNGAIVTCSRQENSELFKLVLGGYGLFGVILDVQLQVVDNVAVQYKFMHLNPEDYVAYYSKYITNNPKVNLVFGRLRISQKHFLEEATLNYFETTNAPIPALQNTKSTETQRLVFRGSVNSEYGKRLRWVLENGMHTATQDVIYSRNELLNDHVSLIENKDTSTTDILQEYFIPPRNFNAFIKAIKPILIATKIDLLNITIREVARDTDSFLNYAQENVFGFVFLFNQQKTDAQELAMKQLTNQLVAVALKNEGTFYLPYRLHCDKNNLLKAYPNAQSFFQLKLKYDPEAIFNSNFYQYYK